MTNSEIAEHLERLSESTGISKADLKRLCLRAGIEQFEREGIRVTRPKPKAESAADLNTANAA